MHPHAALIERFYSAFQQRDAETMVACYHPEIHFSDPVFPDLHGPAAGAMWRMLCARGKDLVIIPSAVQADNDQGSAHWEATYTFSGSGRHVHNIIDAQFAFRDGLIARHTDRFDLWRWSRQALGVSGVLLGWSPIVQGKVRATAAKALADFQNRAQESAK